MKPRGCGRPLGPDNLVTRDEIARELGVRDSDAELCLATVEQVVQGRAPKWRWSDVLDAWRDWEARHRVTAAVATRRYLGTREAL